jgi:hypothetical protein
MIIFSIIGGNRVLSDITNIRSRKSKSASSAGRRWLAAVIYLSLFFSLYACTTQNYGNLKPSSEITKIFENHQVLSDHLYYYSGLQGVPDAIIAIHPDYSLRARQWQQIDLTAFRLKTWVYRMSTAQVISPRGAWILDPDGNRIGIWFSGQRQTAVRLEQNNRVVIAPPNPTEAQRIR